MKHDSPSRCVILRQKDQWSCLWKQLEDVQLSGPCKCKEKIQRNNPPMCTWTVKMHRPREDVYEFAWIHQLRHLLSMIIKWLEPGWLVTTNPVKSIRYCLRNCKKNTNPLCIWWQSSLCYTRWIVGLMIGMYTVIWNVRSIAFPEKSEWNVTRTVMTRLNAPGCRPADQERHLNLS